MTDGDSVHSHIKAMKVFFNSQSMVGDPIYDTHTHMHPPTHPCPTTACTHAHTHQGFIQEGNVHVSSEPLVMAALQCEAPINIVYPSVTVADLYFL